MKRKVMTLLPFYLTAFLSLTACTGLLDDGSGKSSWRPYKDINKSTRYASFIAFSNSGEATDESVGQFFRKDSALDSEEKIGNLFYLFDVNGQSMAIMFLLNQQSVNSRVTESKQQLANSKQFEFYEFGKGRLEHSIFNAPNAICSDYQTGQGVQLKMATNYYTYDKPDGKAQPTTVVSQNSYQTTFITASIKNKTEPNILKYESSLSGSEKEFLNFFRELGQKEEETRTKLNVKEKESVLLNIICS